MSATAKVVREGLKASTEIDFVALREAISKGDIRARDLLIEFAYRVGTPFCELSLKCDEEEAAAAVERVVHDLLDGAFARWDSAGKVKFPMWMKGMLRSRVWTNRRARPEAMLSLDTMDPDAYEDDAPQPDAVLEMKQEVRQLGEKLSDKEADCLALHVAGFQYDEIAQVLNTSIGSVAQAISRARTKGKEQ